ncbi:ABC transporter permease [Nonomuraea sp. H19]|uniref:ABC transporter permease n=1 Tax=Nonomuraea sp. H19 TaxID=3452206 RepID=UPI003F8A34C5
MQDTPTVRPIALGSQAARLREALSGPEFGLIIATFVACTVFTLLSDQFLSGNTLQSVLRAVATIGIVAVGQAFLLIAGEFDLSVGAVAGLGAIVAGQLMHHLPWPIAVGVGLACGGAFGLLNGLVVTMVGVPALVVTLGTLFVAQGLGQVVSGGFPISDLPSGFLAAGRAEAWGLGTAVFVFLAVVVLAELVLHHTHIGLRVYATGGNRFAAQRNLVRPRQTKIMCFAVLGTLSALAGILSIARVGTADPTVGLGWELQAIAGAVVGGVSLFGGRGHAYGALVGVVFLQVISTGFVVVGFDTSLRGLAVGVFLITAIALDRQRVRKRTDP